MNIQIRYDYLSSDQHITYGVPQEFILGSTLFLICLNNLEFVNSEDPGSNPGPGKNFSPI